MSPDYKNLTPTKHTMPHSVHVKPITPDIRCEVIYQPGGEQTTQTFFANEPLIALIRIRAKSTTTPPPPPAGNKISLLSGYVQLSGHFHYSAQHIANEKLQQFKAQTVISGKFGGLEGQSQKVGDNNLGDKWGGIKAMFGLRIEELGQKFGKGLGFDDDGDEQQQQQQHQQEKANGGKDGMENVVFFSSMQTLLFSEINTDHHHNESGKEDIDMLRQFQLTAQLPHFLPSSHEGQAVSIRYELTVGMHVEQESQLQTKLLKFPLCITASFDRLGYQPVSQLDRFYLLPANAASVSELTTRDRRRSSLAAAAAASAAAKKKNEENNNEENNKDKKKAEIVEIMKIVSDTTDEWDLKNDWSSLIEDRGLVQLNCRQSIDKFIERYSATTQNFDTQKEKEAEDKDGAKDQLKPKTIDGTKYTALIKDTAQPPQRKYQLSHNSKPLVLVSLSKPIYKLSEIIKVSLQFPQEPLTRPLGLVLTLETLDIINPEYSSSGNENNASTPPPRTVHFKRNINVTQSNGANVMVELPLPEAGSAAAFKTNIFENRWCFCLRVIFEDSAINIDDSDSFETVLFEDQVGKFMSASADLNGWEFGSVRIPLVVVP